MTEHPGATDPAAERLTAAEVEPEAGTGPDVAAESADAPSESTQATDAPVVDEVEAAEEEPDALGHVEEQTRVPDEESTVPQPGEALDELLPALATTGHDGVDDALATLDEMAGKSVHDHVEVFDAVHEELRRTLDQAADQ